jgi:AAA family ATP:ADP antiporter
VTAFVRRFADVEPNEVRAALWSFACFFSVLCGYYVIRPLREEMGVAYTKAGGSLEHLFTAVFLVMLAAVPVFGWVVGAVARKRIAPVVYLFFIANLVALWLLLNAAPGRWTAAVFYVWVSVFNLFVVSVFWSVMSDVWTSAEAKRLYGFIAAGGSVGAFSGPIITQTLAPVLGASHLVLIPALFLLAAIACLGALRSLLGSGRGDTDEKREGSVIDGAKRVFADPYLRQIAIWAVIASLIATFVTYERNAIVGAIADQNARVQLFARIDIATNVLTVIGQLLVTGALIKRLGVGATLGIVPVAAIIGLALLGIWPTLAVIVLVTVATRALGYAVANPSMRVLYTVVDPADKYRAQNFNDTVVVRASDAASGWLISGLGRSLGFASTTLALLAIPFAAAWLVLSLRLGHQQERRARLVEHTPKP